MDAALPPASALLTAMVAKMDATTTATRWPRSWAETSLSG
jgi:hypothetical protein